MKIKIKDYREIIFLGTCLFLIYYQLLQQHFSVDSYSVLYTVDVNTPLSAGRLFFALINMMFNLLNINPVLMQEVCTGLFLIIVTIYLAKLSNILVKYINNRMICNLALLLSVSNVFFLELFLYPEVMLIYGFGFGFTVAAVCYIDKYESKANIFLSGILLLLALNCYQAFLGLFLIYVVSILLVKYNFEMSRDLWKHLFITIFMAMLVSIIQMYELKVIQSMGILRQDNKELGFGISRLIDNGLFLLREQKSIWWNANGFLPEGVPFVFLVFVLLVYAFLMKQEIKECIFVTLIMLGAYLSIYIIHIFVGDIWLAPRTILANFSIISAVILCIGKKVDWEKQAKKTYGFYLVVTVFILINGIQIHNITRNHFISNSLDKEYSRFIQSHIEKYEENNNMKVTKIASCNDMNPTYFYSAVDYCVYDTNIRAFVTEWADVNMLNYYNSREYMKIDMPNNIYEKYFKDKNWDYYIPEEQLIFDEDTLYWVKY